ncbi:unnamed protein product [Acanthoscelides obtectus]|uniref:Uncharacterized protein n=1 Tax=Acanthoscelides obtectus TaxID=200917 RepID=A0A9P0JX93_ACAOB|nr:unnamed protein product [Acanthoscelides obtectus]CAK1638118.1 hypothetical protein AOBTE_LOCUS10398 [Acanthoscelides obtectus]
MLIFVYISFFFNMIWSVLCSTSKSRETFSLYLVIDQNRCYF